MRNDRGFALLEVIVAAALLVVLAAGTSRIVAAAVREGHASKERAVATIAAAGKIEEVRSLPPGDVSSGVDYLDASGTLIGATIPRPGAAAYVRRWMVQPIDGDPDVVALTVEVSIPDGTMRARLVSVRAAR
jgi:prepilin-type N-terminal cleavage/methylation domain-containing protein